MKKFLLALLLCFVFTGSGFAGDFHVVAAIFPIYDWIHEISAGSGLKVTLLLDNGVDLHSYLPSVQDIVRISEADMFVYVGGESDNWVHDALKNTVNKNQITVNLLQVLGEAVKHDELVEGMEHKHHEHEEHEHEHEELDEHVWLSLRNAEKICRHIAEKLSRLDNEHSQLFSDNLAAYLEKLSALDNAYEAAINYSARKTLLFADRFPFRYLADDYALKYYAAFSGCSAETEASFHTVKFLAEKVDELHLPCVITIEGTHHKIAQTVIASTSAKKQNVLVLNSMQSTTLRDVLGGASYLAIMAANLDVLKEALN